MTEGLPEFNTRTVLDVVEENFKELNLKAYACRMIYVGDHAFDTVELMKLFEKTVVDVNAGYCDVHVSGLLLAYDTYFIHILEGSEDTIHRQIRFLFQKEKSLITEELNKTQNSSKDLQQIGTKQETYLFKRTKVLMVYHSITNRLFNTWKAVAVRPPVLVTKLDIYIPFPQHIEQLKICLDKIKRTCEVFTSDSNYNFKSLTAADHKLVPEGGVLDFLLSSKYIMDLREVFHLHRRVDDYIFYFEEVWPLSTHFTPRHLFKLKVDDSFVEPLPVMPWEVEKKEQGEDEENEEHVSAATSGQVVQENQD